MPQEGLGDALESSIPLPGPRLGPLGSLGARRQHQPTHTSPHLPRPTDTTSRTPQADPHAAIHEAPNEHLSEKTRSRREKRRPVVVGRVSQRSVGVPSGRAQPTKPLPLAGKALPSLLCSMLKRCSTVLHANPRDCLPSLTERPETRDACPPPRADRRRCNLQVLGDCPVWLCCCLQAGQSSLSGGGEQQTPRPPVKNPLVGSRSLPRGTSSALACPDLSRNPAVPSGAPRWLRRHQSSPGWVVAVLLHHGSNQASPEPPCRLHR